MKQEKVLPKPKTLLEALQLAVAMKSRQVVCANTNAHTGLPNAGPRNPAGAKLVRRLYKRHHGTKSEDTPLEKASAWWDNWHPLVRS